MEWASDKFYRDQQEKLRDMLRKRAGRPKGSKSKKGRGNKQ